MEPGLLGYYRQISSDSGPQYLNGGSPEAFSTGLGCSYRTGRFNLVLDVTKDLYARNIARKGMITTAISYRL